MLLLESYDRFDDLVELEPTTGQLRWFSKHSHPDVVARPVHGIVSQLDGHMVLLYREGDVLHLRVDDMDIELTDNTHIELKRGEVNVLKVLRDDASIFCLEYQPYVADEVDKWRMYFDPFIEEEHFDFGLFLHNLMKDTNRRHGVYR